MNIQREHASKYTEGYVQISPDQLATPTIIYEMCDDPLFLSSDIGKAGLRLNSLSYPIGTNLDVDA